MFASLIARHRICWSTIIRIIPCPDITMRPSAMYTFYMQSLDSAACKGTGLSGLSKYYLLVDRRPRRGYWWMGANDTDAEAVAE
jgi:hypothetical protein